MNTDISFETVIAQEFAPFEDEFSICGAILNGPDSFDPFDPMGLYFDHPFHNPNLPLIPDHFSDQYHIPVDLASPGELSSPSLPPSPLSCADDLDPTFANIESKPAKSAKAELEGFERNPITRKWVCAKCGDDFVSTHEARRHERTAAKCTGKKAKCLRCDDHIHTSPYSRKRHFASKKCQKKGRKKGVPTYTVNTAFVEL